MNLWEVMPALAILCLGTGLYIWVCFRFPPAIALGVVAYSMITKCASVAYIETADVYLIEVGMISQVVGATPRQIFYNLFIFIVALAIIRWVITWKRPWISLRIASFGTPDYNRELRLALIISAALLGVQLLNAALSPPYGLPGFGVDRQQFWAHIRYPVLADLIGVLVIFVPAISGVALAYGKVTNQRYFRRFNTILMLAYSLYFLLTGARFGGPLTALLIWLTSYWIVLWAFGVELHVKRIGLILTVAVSVFVAAGYREIADRGITTMTGSTWNGFLYRAFALQGNVAFAADVLTSDGESRPTSLLLADMATMEQTYMPSGLAAAYINKGVNLIGSLPGSSTLVFGYWLGLVPMAIFGILLGLITALFIFIVLSGRFILVLPAAYLCLWVYNAEARGSFEHFLDYKFILFAWLVIIGLLLPSGTRHHSRPIRARTAHSTKGDRDASGYPG